MLLRFHSIGCRAIYFANLSVCFLALHPAASQAQSSWVISAIHPDPTPFLGAPESEYIALFSRDSVSGCRSTQGLKLFWNGHERAIPDSCWPGGRTLVIHRSADSVHFQDQGLQRVPLETWPALVNGGTTLFLLDSSGRALDAMPYSEHHLEGGGRPLLRKDPWACGAGVNQVLWTPSLSPFHPVGADESEEGTHLTSQGLLASSADFDRWIPRGPAHWEWRLAGSVDPAGARSATLSVGGVDAALEWVSDSVVVARWPGRARPQSFGEGGLENDIPVVLGPIRSCAPHAPEVWLKQSLHHLAQFGEVQPIEVLSDPKSGDPNWPEEYLTLMNRSERPLDVGGWDWGGGFLRRRRILWPGQPTKFTASEFEHWPGLTNSGGSLKIWSPMGSEVTALSWSPCDHQFKSMVGSGLPLFRSAEPYAGWQTLGTSPSEEPLELNGYGCKRGWTGGVEALEVHLNRPSFFLPSLEWSLVLDSDPDPWALEVNRVDDQPQSLILTAASGAMELEWPSRGSLLARESHGHDVVLAVPELSCPSEMDPVCVKIDEILWDAQAAGEEFVEVWNCGHSPADLSGLAGSVESDPAPNDWDEWVSPDCSLVLMPGHVMAFGECPKWFTADHDRAGKAVWPVQHWSALNDEVGQLSLRLPSSGTERLDSVNWTSEMEGPWWWSSDGWSWVRSPSGGSGWTPSKDKGSPGRAQFIGPQACDGANRPVVTSGTTQGSLPSVHWDFPSPGHQIEVRIVGWPEGRLKGFERLGLDLARGSWTWNGRGVLGQPVAPQAMILDVRWRGPVCRGRQSIKTRVPGYGK